MAGRRASVLLALTFRTMGFAAPLACQAVPTDAARVLGWRSDIDSLVRAAQAVHASPARPAHSPAFLAAAGRLKADIPQLSDARVVVALQGLMAMLGDGHSLVYPVPARVTAFPMLPIELYLFTDGLYIVGGLDAAGALVGSRVRRFGPLSTDQVLARMAPYVSRDNPMGVKAFAGLYLVLPEFLEAWGATSDPRRVELTVTDTLGHTRVVSLEAGPARRIRRRLHPPRSDAPPPLYLRDADRPFAMTRLPDADALYLQVNQVADGPDGLTLADLARAVLDTVRECGATRLIIDVRHNTGGNNRLLAPLVEAVRWFADTSGRVYVLTGRSTFSAAQNLVNRIERAVPQAVFAGEPSMSSPNFTGEDNPVTLPYSGLVVSISNRYWQDSRPDDRRPWIAPRIPIAMRSSDWLHGRDPVLDAVLRDIRRQRRRSGQGGR